MISLEAFLQAFVCRWVFLNLASSVTIMCHAACRVTSLIWISITELSSLQPARKKSKKATGFRGKTKDFQPDLLYFDGNSVSRMKPWSAKPSRTICWGQWISLENLTISLVAFKDMLDGDKIITVPQISCYRHFIHGCKTLCEWAKWMNLTGLCERHWFCLIAPKMLLLLKALLSIRPLHNAI